MEIPIFYHGYDWLFIIDDYDYEKGQKESGPTYTSGGEPSYPETISINKYHLEIDSEISIKLQRFINNQLQESNKLCEYLFNKYNDFIHEAALEEYHTEIKDALIYRNI